MSDLICGRIAAGEKYNLTCDTLADGVIISHKEGHSRGIASNHGDPEHLWSQLGTGYTMDTFRKAVKNKISGASDEKKTESVSTASHMPATPFSVKIIIDDLNLRSEPSMNGTIKGQTGKGLFTIVEVKNGWGRLKSGAGWIWLENPSYCIIQGTVTKTAKTSSTKSVDEIAKEVIRGEWGNGEERKKKLVAAGYDYNKVQKRVNELIK